MDENKMENSKDLFKWIWETNTGKLKSELKKYEKKADERKK